MKDAKRTSTKQPTAEYEGKRYYKVLLEGRSFHGGDTQWSLPNGRPGKWHKIKGEPEMCRRGFHVTCEPARWFAKGATVYAVQIGGKVVSDGSDKIAAAQCRLVRELGESELAEVGIFLSGRHEVRTGKAWAGGSATVEAGDSATVVAYDSAKVVAGDSATVEAYDSATVRAYGSATVDAGDSATVYAGDSATVNAYGSATVRAYDSATVYAGDSATVNAGDSATVEAYDSATVRAYGSATVDAGDSATVNAYGSATVRAYDSATVRANNSATVEAGDSATVVAYDSAKVEAFGSATVSVWCGSPSVSLEHYAVCIDRRNQSDGGPTVTTSSR